MGSKYPFSYTGITTLDTSDTRVSLLVNSISYFLQCAYIMKERGGYRLVVIQNNRVLTDGNYKSMKGARIAFQRRFGDMAWQDGVKPSWSLPR